MTDTSTVPPSGQPSRNPSQDGRLYGVFRVALKKFLQGKVDDMLPAQVVAYNRTTNMASVQPLINVVTTLNTVQPRAQVASVPVLQMGGGGFVLNFPVRAGDLGWLKANDRDISLFKQVWGMIAPASGRMHDFADSIFIPSILTNFTIESADASNVVLQAVDGSTRLSMGAGNTVITDEAAYSQSTSAVLDVQSTTRAFKVPRMTTAQQGGIASPIGGMIVYLTDASPTPKFSYYVDGVGWS